MTYAAPLKDMMFVIRELAGLDAVRSLPGFEEATAFVNTLAPVESVVMVQTIKPGDAAAQTFGRWLARVWTPDGVDVAVAVKAGGFGE